MKLFNMKCPNCGASLQPNEDLVTARCEYCGTTTIIDYEDSNIHLPPKNQSPQIANLTPHTSYNSTVSNIKNYTYNAYNESKQIQANKETRKKVLWILGWIFIFPVPLTILVIRKKELQTSLKICIIAAAWIIYLVIGLVGTANDQSINEDDSYLYEEYYDDSPMYGDVA